LEINESVVFIIKKIVTMHGHMNVKSNPFTGLEWPRGFQEVKVPSFHDDGTGWW
jgi:hypothetical protein